MREIESKARVEDPQRIKEILDSRYGEGRPVHKDDHYFHRPGELIQSLRIRQYGGRIEITTKHNSRDRNGENNLEYEFLAASGEYEKAVAFFHALGHEDYFRKIKDGWEWNDGDAHIELFSVNDLGYFIEIEILIPFDADEECAERSGRRVRSLLSSLDLGKSIEPRADRDMILGRSSNGMEGQPYTGEGQRVR